MIREGLKNLAAGANPMVMKKGMAKAVETAVEAIKANSQDRQRHGRYRPRRHRLQPATSTSAS